jgi:hypothetical protein
VLITHELNENPFAAAFMDWRAELRLFRVTVTRSTLVEWRCSFRTTAHVRAAPAPAKRCGPGGRGLLCMRARAGTSDGRRGWQRPCRGVRDVLSGTRTAGLAAS